MEYKSLEEWALKETGRPEGNLDEFVLGRIAERDRKIEVLEEERKRLDEKIQYFKGALSALEKENERLNQKVEELEELKNSHTPTISPTVEEPELGKPEALEQPGEPEESNEDEEKVKRFFEALLGGDKDGDGNGDRPEPEENEEEEERRKKIADGFGNFLNAIDEMANKIDEEIKARREKYSHSDNLALVDGFVMDTIMKGAPAIKAMLDKWVPQYNYRGEIALMDKIYEALLAVICLDTEDVYAAIADALREPEGYNGDLGQGHEAEQNGGNDGPDDDNGNNGNNGDNGPDDYNDFWSGGFGNA